MILLAVVGYALLAVYEYKNLYKQRLKRDYWVNMGIGIFSFAIAILLCLNVKIPSPEKPIREFIVSIFGK